MIKIYDKFIHYAGDTEDEKKVSWKVGLIKQKDLYDIRINGWKIDNVKKVDKEGIVEKINEYMDNSDKAGEIF